jgi:uncharacterized phage-associated protein
MLNILDVARYLLSLGPMNHKKLQKICYYIQAWHLAFTGEPLIDTEFQAWAHGPVSPVLYQAYREWGGLTIPKITYEQYNLNIPEKFKTFIKAVYELYKKYTADELEFFTHKESPWIDARGDVPEGQPCKNVIPNDSIKNFYKGYITNDNNSNTNK